MLLIFIFILIEHEQIDLRLFSAPKTIILGFVEGWARHLKFSVVKDQVFLVYRYQVLCTLICVPVVHDRYAVHNVYYPPHKPDHLTDQAPFNKLSPLVMCAYI